MCDRHDGRAAYVCRIPRPSHEERCVAGTTDRMEGPRKRAEIPHDRRPAFAVKSVERVAKRNRVDFGCTSAEHHVRAKPLGDVLSFELRAIVAKYVVLAPDIDV